MKHFENLLSEALDSAFAATSEAGAPSKKDSGHDSPPKGYPKDKSKYADPTNHKYPLDTCDRVRSALSYWGNEKNRSEYSSSEQSFIANRIHKAAKKCGIDSGK